MGSELENNVLRNFGGFPANSLLEVLSVDNFQNTESEEIEMVRHSPYYNLDNIPAINSDHFSVLSINIQSIRAKMDNLLILVSSLKELNIEFSAICIQESWLSTDSDTSLLQIPDYECISQGYKVSSHGGLMIYLHDKYDYNLISCSPSSNTWEGIFIKVYGCLLRSPVILGNVYKPPKQNNNNNNIQTFMDDFFPIMQLLSSGSSDCLIAGDFNINLLKINEREIIGNFVDRLFSCSFYPKITLPTRFSSHSCSLIDNIFTKLSKKSINTNSGILLSAISDHLPYFTTITPMTNPKPTRPVSIKVRHNNRESVANMLNDLTTDSISEQLNPNISTDPNVNFDIFIQHLTNKKEKHFPTKTVKFHKHRHKKNKWITFSLIKSIKHRDKLYQKLKCLHQNSYEYAELKSRLSKFNSILKKLIRV
jgi:hypothetical protein